MQVYYFIRHTRKKKSTCKKVVMDVMDSPAYSPNPRERGLELFIDHLYMWR